MAFAKDRLLVTVRKKAEPEDSIPQTVRVFRKEDISRLRLQSPTDISALTSGFSFNDPFGRFNPSPSIRGMIGTGLGDEPSVAFFNDGQYLSGRSSINSLAFDLDRIEVAKGPQSALYGRNSFGGAINAISARPTPETYVSLDGMVGSHNRTQITAVANGALSDVVSARFAYYRRDWGGYFDNALDGGPEIGQEKTEAGRLSLRFTPTPDRDIILRLTHIHDDDSQPKGFLVPANCGPRVGDNVLRYYCGEIPEEGEPYAANAGHDGYQRQHTRAGMEWTERLNDNTDLFLNVGGSTEWSKFSRDDDYSAVQAARAGIDTRRYDLQADARLQYTPDDASWSGMLGIAAYRFFNHTRRMDQYYVLGQTRPGGAVGTGLTHTASVYGNFSVPLQNNFLLSLDGRAQREWKQFHSDIRNLAGVPLDMNGQWTAFTPKATLSWQQGGSGIMYYASAGKGYKSGGFNDRANIFDSERLYGPEQNWTYELGVKNVSVTPSLSLDAALFYVDWKDQQVTGYSQAGATNNFFLTNAAESHVKGLETALHWQMSEQTRLGLYYTYADARFDKYNDPDLATIQGFAPSGSVAGNRLPRYSPHHMGVDVEDRREFAGTPYTIVTGAQFSLQSSQYTDNGNLAETGMRTILNLQSGLERGDAYAGIYVDNVTDERDPSVGISWSDAAAGFSRAWLVVPQDGRTFGVRAKVKF